MKLSVVILSLLSLCTSSYSLEVPPAPTTEPVLASMLWTEKDGFELVEDFLTTTKETVARANFTNAINATGWSYLEIDTVEKFPDKVQVGQS